MKISELIKQLEEIKEKDGDIPVAFKKPILDQHKIRWLLDNVWISDLYYKIKDTDNDVYKVYGVDGESKVLFFF
ncbi:hypothetical protein HPU229334_00775 [Helicobacter pullorum]|uniref:Uncharacterized protein n=1 Tax=Helicobacter pullorum TaxID=35818 RepID=A0A0N1E9U7_9HELI|nr:hypothetical protein [Helicobacter pullorum]KPH53967.1 hypothetical protein HPU229334_00775 [Helicobacter pullorum]